MVGPASIVFVLLASASVRVVTFLAGRDILAWMSWRPSSPRRSYDGAPFFHGLLVKGT